MDISEALEKAWRVLEEEEVEPTLGYRYMPPSDQSDRVPELQAMAAYNLALERSQRPRKVHEDPKLYAFQSTNFDLLIKLFSQVADADRATFVSTLLTSVRKPIAARANRTARFPTFQGETSALALLAEFCIRTGHLKELLAATAEPKMPAGSLAIMLKEIEEIIALNFNLFSDSELAAIPPALATLREIAERQTYSARGVRGGPMKNSPHYKQGFSEVGNEIVEAIDRITEECRKVRFWYLMGALQELPNL
jgi:hypothetical protein